ncbi:hypothetical protein EOD39_12401 [Acipenser ruthenus]|uniref:Uncharacterized protein n=1 Tax=Acipenser ruthenus TaxID=7906 RepID=A0A662YSN5_ACIRT|nr:hypothetical protein EOD39_12401 [Acipenser ruthenus]
MESMLWKVKRRERIDQEELQGAAAGSTDGKEKREVEEGRESKIEDGVRNEEGWRNIDVKTEVKSPHTTPARATAHKQEEATSLQDVTGQQNHNKAAYTPLPLQFSGKANWQLFKMQFETTASIEG